MESSVASYLHKKFKKQLSVEPRPHQNDKENKNSPRSLESCEEERTTSPQQPTTKCSSSQQIQDNQNITDNNAIVPNQSTNETSSFVANSSSISVENPSNSCISYVVSNQQNHVESPFNRPVSFDTKFSSNSNTEPKFIPNMSSIIGNIYSKPNYVIKNEDTTSQNQPDDQQIKEETQDPTKPDEIQPPPDRNPNGKYVCTYCNLVCSKPSVLQKHIRAHTNERPYPCISCGFSFKTRSNLYKHCRSRTHANRVMGNKAQELNNESESPNKTQLSPPKSPNSHLGEAQGDHLSLDVRMKPYKPRFHTAKQFIENVTKENIMDEDRPEEDQSNYKSASSDLLSHHINEIINKNNSIVNSNEYAQRYRGDSYYSPNIIEQRTSNTSDEPLNLTNKNRKRCMSEVAEPIVQKSLIKELLLKNLYSDMQCIYCKMIFQTVTELELHKLRSCKGKPSGAKYTRSSSVNVASILTQNKNAFDNIPQLQNTYFPLGSPGPFLGKTRLVDSDKSKSFSFDDGLRANFSAMNTSSELSPSYLLSPLPFDREKKIPVKLFGGEVKITHTSGETKSFKIDQKEGEKFEPDVGFLEYGGKLSENRVIKSSLQSGGTVLTNKTNYNSKDGRVNQDVIRVYENTSVSPSIDMANLNKTKFNFDRHPDLVPDKLNHSEITMLLGESITSSTTSPSYKYTNIMDFSQNAVKLLTPNLRQPNFSIPAGMAAPKFPFSNLPVENKSELHLEQLQKLKTEMDVDLPQNLTRDMEINSFNLLSRKRISFPRKPIREPQISTCNPVNLLVNGKVVRYLPGMPGPVAAEEPMDIMGYNVGNNVPLPRKVSPIPQTERGAETKPTTSAEYLLQREKMLERMEKPTRMMETLEIRTTDLSPRINEMRSPISRNSDIKSPVKSLENKLQLGTNAPKKFARPNSLALKPTTASLKQHHGLTPTMFNQILISPDTPRVAKKYAQHFLHGNYFSYLGLKSSTKPVYCTLNKTQPFYVPHFKKLSMYSEWRQQDTKTDKLYVSAYDSRQKSRRYTTAGKTMANLIIHSSYKFIVSELPLNKSERGGEEQQKSNAIPGGYESYEDYTYIRGRGRGRYVCDQCGIRCKKPSMLKKHIRTHSNDRPYTCSHCNFSFKTKGNLTKHMKSKAHTKNYTASSSSGSSTQQSGTQSSDSDTDDSGMDSSDESTRQQEHEAAYGLLSLSQKNTQNVTSTTQSDMVTTSPIPNSPTSSANISDVLMSTEEIAQVSKRNYMKNKIMDEKSPLSFTTSMNFSEISTLALEETKESRNILQFLGKSSVTRPLTYPYTSPLPTERDVKPRIPDISDNKLKQNEMISPGSMDSKPKCIKQFHVIKKYALEQISQPSIITAKVSADVVKEASPVKNTAESNYQEELVINNVKNLSLERRPMPQHNETTVVTVSNSRPVIVAQTLKSLPSPGQMALPTLKVNGVVVANENVSDLRKRKIATPAENSYKNKMLKNGAMSTSQDDEVMDLSITTTEKHREPSPVRANGGLPLDDNQFVNKTSNFASINPFKKVNNEEPASKTPSPKRFDFNEDSYNKPDEIEYKNIEFSTSLLTNNNGKVLLLKTVQNEDVANNVNVNVNVNYIVQGQQPNNNTADPQKNFEYDNSAMETLADIATKQVKLEKNTLAKSVASEFLKLATKNECYDGARESNSFAHGNKEVNELIVKPEGNKSCTICSKSFSKPSQLRLHMNIHYLERPFRCDSCSVSFRTKGHLQKHERSASHHNKLSSSPALSSSEPRPFKCTDCNIAFRIHGHLAKHLRSKMHIMKLECLAKIPFGLYAELERSNSLLTEINTCDGDQCLESLKTLAKKVFINDPNKLNQLEYTDNIDADS